MKMKKNLMMMLAACLALSVPLSGCGSTVKDTSSSVSSEVSGEAETSGKSSQELLDEEKAIPDSKVHKMLPADTAICRTGGRRTHCQVSQPAGQMLSMKKVYQVLCGFLHW